MSEDRARYVWRFELAARIIAESCESCLQREFDFIIEDAFVCETCAWEGPQWNF
jgi:hypothetical protein